MNGAKINIVIFIMFAVASGSIWFTMPSNENLYDDIDLSEVEQTLANIEYGDQVKNETTNILYQTGITKIVIHHTATNPSQHPQALFNAIQNAHARRWIRGGIQKTGQQMMYHRLIGSDGTIRGTKDFNEIGRGTKENNIGVIHIAMQGDFNKEKPTDKQYESLKQVINSLNARYGELKIVGHGQLEEEHTACPGKLFDYSVINPVGQQHSFNENLVKELSNKAISSAGIEIPTDKSYNILFDLSRYYSPVPGQTSYFQGKTYEQDKSDQFGNDPDITTSATGKKYTMADKNRSVACPPQIPKGSKISLWIKGEGYIVTCEDRGSAIQGNRLDMYCGIGQFAIDNWSTCITGKIYGKVI